MISFSKIMEQVLTERLSFRDLLRHSDPARVRRGEQDVRAKSIRVSSSDEGETWNFNYKSNPSTTGNRWHGYVRFFKEDVSRKDNAEDLDCQVDCDCPDFRYRWAYNNARADVTPLGAGSINRNNGRPPRPYNDLGVGMCKHLCSLGEFLKTKIEPTAPEPEDEAPQPVKPTSSVSKVTPATPQTSNAPNPEDSYSDSRGGLEESRGNLFERISQFVNQNPEFDVPVHTLNESVMLVEGYQRGEWWIDESGQTIFADGDVGDSNHEAVVIQSLIREILSHFGIDDDEPGELYGYEETIFQSLKADGRLSDEEISVWNNEMGKGSSGGPAPVIIKKLLEDGVFKDKKQASAAVFIAYGSGRDARDYAMEYWRWKIMKTSGSELEVTTWHLQEEDLGIIVRGVWEIMDDHEDDEDEDSEDPPEDPYPDGYKGPRLNVTVQASGKRFYDIPLEVLEKKMPATLHAYQSGVHVGYTETITEDYHHLHKEYRLYEGHRKIVAVFEDNTRLSFEVHFRDKHKEDREKWRRKAFTKWKSLASEIHGDVPLSAAMNPMQKSWKQSFKEALRHPELQEFIRNKPHQKVFDDKGYPASVQGKPQACIDPVNFTRMG